MQRFVLTFFFIILCLGQAQAYAQQNTTPPDTSEPAITEQNENPAKGDDGETDETKDQTDENGLPSIVGGEVSRKEVPALSTSDEIAEKANFWSMLQAIFAFGTLCLAFFATLFALGAWLAGRKAVKVGKIDVMGNLIVKDIRHSPTN